MRLTEKELSRLTHCTVRETPPRRAALPLTVKQAESRSVFLTSSRASSGRSLLTPHEILWAAIIQEFPFAEKEKEGIVPGRGFRADIAFPDQKISVEVDGWEWHGKHKGDFIRDRHRQNLFVLQGWRVLRYTAGQIRKEMDTYCLPQIRAALALG